VWELECGKEFDPAREEEFFSTIPSRRAVFLIEPHAGHARPYLGRSADLRRRLGALLGRAAEPSRRLNLRDVAARVRYRLTGSLFEQSLVLYHQAVAIHPARYREWMRLRPPALIKLKLASAYPRCYVTRRLLSDGALYLGPFASRRAADAFLNQFLNFFKVRRCQIRIRRDPSFPGCIYSEMKMCLAPCFAGCTDQEYGTEVGRVSAFLSTGGNSLLGEMEQERDATTAALDFERSAALHKKIEKVTATLRLLPELARKLEDLSAVVLQLAAGERSIAVFPVRRGYLSLAFLLEFGSMAANPQSVEAILRERLETDTPDERPGGRAGLEVLADHLSLLARWYYSKPRAGEILYFDPARGGWPYRRIVRACSRLLARESGASAGH
jgi:excinuclease UvrABC nuclease subunit